MDDILDIFELKGGDSSSTSIALFVFVLGGNKMVNCELRPSIGPLCVGLEWRCPDPELTPGAGTRLQGAGWSAEGPLDSPKTCRKPSWPNRAHAGHLRRTKSTRGEATR